MKYPVQISIVMPAFNVESYIEFSIKSIIKQSFSSWELIIIDDASTDNTVDLIRSFKDTRIRLFCLNQNRGNYAARNFGLTHARGKYIASFDADDISLPHRLQWQYDYLEKKKSIGAIGSNFTTIDKNGIRLTNSNMECTYLELKVRLLIDNHLLHSTLFVRHHLLKKYNISYEEKYRYASDYHFVFQCSTYFKILNIPEYLVLYRTNPNSITKTKFKEQQHYASQIRRNILGYFFGDILSPTDYDIFDKLMCRYKSNNNPANLDQIEKCINKILIYNQKEKFFSQSTLYKFLYYKSIKYSIETGQIKEPQPSV